MTGLRRVLFALLLVMLWPGLAVAHPHVFIDWRLRLANGQLWLDWRFDPMFSQMVLEDNGLTPQPVFDAAATATLKERAFSNLAHFNYFLDWQGPNDSSGQHIPPPQGFTARWQDNRLEYSFALPAPTERSRLRLYDPDFFVDLQPLQPPLAAGMPCTITEGTDIITAWGTIAPPIVICEAVP